MTKHKNNARELLLNLMLEIVRKEGATRLTYDNLVAKSNLTRGGIMYHFPSKQSMLEGLVNHYVALDMKRTTERWNLYGSTPDGLLKAEIECAMEANTSEQNLASALLPVIATNPALLDDVRSQVRARYDMLHDTKMGFERAALVLMALDCFEMSKAFGIEMMNAKQRKKFLTFLLKLSESKESL